MIEEQYSKVLHFAFFIFQTFTSCYRFMEDAFFERSLFFTELCPLGYFSADGLSDGQNSCKMCPKNTYADKFGSKSCLRCPNGTTTDGSGRTSITACRCKFCFYIKLSYYFIFFRCFIVFMFCYCTQQFVFYVFAE